MAKTLINNSGEAYASLKGLFTRSMQEEVAIATLDNRNRLLGAYLVAVGSDTAVVFPVKTIARRAVLDNACGVIVAHTHPHGDSSPSTSDCKETEKLRDGLKCLEVSLMDHLVIGEEDYYSFASGKKTATA